MKKISNDIIAYTIRLMKDVQLDNGIAALSYPPTHVKAIAQALENMVRLNNWQNTEVEQLLEVVNGEEEEFTAYAKYAGFKALQAAIGNYFDAI